MLARQKIATLHGIALHCGYPAVANKTERIKAIEETSHLYSSIKPAPLNILSIDVGIKNFSYAKALYERPLEQARSFKLHDWNHVNLHDQFGASLANSSTSLPKTYLARLADSVVNKIILSDSWVPSVILMESQRTRSNTNSVTLPNVLLNYTLEHMIYAAYTARLDAFPSYKDVPILATNSGKMVNFWLNRFIKKDSRMNLTFSKKLRAGLFFGWLADSKASPIDLLEISSRLPSDFGALTSKKQTSYFLDSFSFATKPGKADDLIDCMLYNIGAFQQLLHHFQLQHQISHDKDVLPLLELWNNDHLRYVAPVVERFDLALRPEFCSWQYGRMYSNR